MLDPSHPIAELLRQDRRYKFDAYLFVFESLRFAQEVLGLGVEQASDSVEEEAGLSAPADTGRKRPATGETAEGRGERHLSGQELCEAIRLYALQQYGYMAKSVLNHWGVTRTSDFGEIVFNLIEIGQMRKTEKDCREDFDNVFDFDDGLKRMFQFRRPE